MSRSFRAEQDQPEPQVALNREDRRKKQWRPEEDPYAQRFSNTDRLRDTRSRATFVRRLGPR